VVAALEALRRKAAGERPHLVGKFLPGPGLPDAQVLLADRGQRAAHQRVVQQQLGKSVVRPDVDAHRACASSKDGWILT
jgi:hypothetical protein